jgi:predicted RNA-binding protein with TRAM domain
VSSIGITTQPVAGAASGSVLATQPVVRLLDAQGNLINDRSSTVTVSSELAAGGAGGSVGGTTSVSTSTGIATFTDLTFGGLVGTSYKLKFTSGAVTQLSSNVSNTLAGPPAQVSIQTQPTLTGTQLVGSAFTTQPVVSILDAGGNTTTSTATITATASGGTLGGTAAVAAVSGTATYSGLTFAGLVSIPYTLTFTSSGLTSATSSTFQFGAGQFGPVSTTVTTISASPSTRPADGTSTSTVTVQAKDAGGNNLTSSQGSVTLSATAGTLGAVTDNANGTYTATFTAPASRGTGTSTISGTLAGAALTQTASIGLFTTQTITFTQPANVPLGTLPYALTATASSGLAVAFTSATTSVCTVTSGGVVTILTVGTCTINADQAGDSTYWQAPQVTQSFQVTATTPSAPYITSVTEQNAQASVAFTAPGFDGGASITNYEYTLNGGTTWTALSPTDATSPITIPSLTNGTAYAVAIRAVNSAGSGLASNTSGTFTPAASGGTTVTTAATTPSAPRNAQVTAEPSTTATVAWQEPQSNGGATITSYTVDVSPTGTCTATIAPASRNGSCTVTGLTPGVTYTFTIRAVNSIGAGTPASVTYTVPGGGSALGSAPIAVTLTFDSGPGACSTSSLTGARGEWVGLPGLSSCRRPSHVLVGWQPVWSTVRYAPGTFVELTDDNTLRAIWGSVSVDSGNSSAGSGITGEVRTVVWSGNGKSVRRGQSQDLTGHRPVFSVVTRDSARVSDATVATAKALAREHDGAYVGVVRGNWWVRPRIVAAYLD